MRFVKSPGSHAPSKNVRRISNCKLSKQDKQTTLVTQMFREWSADEQLPAVASSLLHHITNDLVVTKIESRVSVQVMTPCALLLRR